MSTWTGQGEARPMLREDNDRHWKLVLISPQTIINLLLQNSQQTEYISYLRIVGVPNNYIVDDIRYDQHAQAFALTIYHPTFPIIAKYEFIRPTETYVEVVRLVKDGFRESKNLFAIRDFEGWIDCHGNAGKLNTNCLIEEPRVANALAESYPDSRVDHFILQRVTK